MRAAIGVLQRIGVTTVILRARSMEELSEALERTAPYARLSLGVCMHADWLSQTTLYNTEVIMPICFAASMWAASMPERPSSRMRPSAVTMSWMR